MDVYLVFETEILLKIFTKEQDAYDYIESIDDRHGYYYVEEWEVDPIYNLL